MYLREFYEIVVHISRMYVECLINLKLFIFIAQNIQMTRIHIFNYQLEVNLMFKGVSDCVQHKIITNRMNEWRLLIMNVEQ